MISVYYNCWPHTTEAGITWCFFHMLLGAESGSYREGKKAIKNLLKQIFLPRGESLLITKQIGRDDKWLYISILFSFLLFFFSLHFLFWKGQLKGSMPTVPISISTATGCRWFQWLSVMRGADPFKSGFRQVIHDSRRTIPQGRLWSAL